MKEWKQEIHTANCSYLYGREALANCQCLYRKNKALFVSVDLIGEKNQVILECKILIGSFQEYISLFLITGICFNSEKMWYKKNNNTRIEPVGEPYSEVCFNPELWFGMVSQPNSLWKRLGRLIEHVLAYCRDGKKYVGCIELLFKLHRATCRY